MQVSGFYDNGHTECILIQYHLALVSTKKANDADLVVHVDNAAPAKDTFRIERPVSGDIRITSDPKAPAVRLSEDELMNKGFTLSHQDLKNQTIKEGYKFNAGVVTFINVMKDNTSLCYTRKLNPKNEKSAVTYFYHIDAQSKLMEYLQKKGQRREIEALPLFSQSK